MDSAVQEEVKTIEVDKSDSISGEGSAKKDKGILKIAIFAGVSLFLISGSVGGTLFFTGFFSHKATPEEIAAEKNKPVAIDLSKIAFYAMPEMLVNLTRQGKKASFLRMVVKLELTNGEEVKTLDALKPRIIDQFQAYLRELRVEDVEGSSGLQRLREELLKRVNQVVAPIKVHDILFETLLVQ